MILVDVWTYSCIDSLSQLPYITRWAAKYKDAGLVVVGVHMPESPFEKERNNVAWAVANFHVPTGLLKEVQPVPQYAAV